MGVSEKLGIADSIISQVQDVLEHSKVDKVSRSGRILLRKDLESLYASVAQWRAINSTEDA